MAREISDSKIITYWDEGELLSVFEFSGTAKDAADALEKSRYFDDEFFKDSDEYKSVLDVAKELVAKRKWTDDDEHVFCIGTDVLTGGLCGRDEDEDDEDEDDED